MNHRPGLRIEPPRPYYLFEAVPEEVVAVLAPLVPEFKAVAEGEEVHESDFDAVVSFSRQPTQREPHLPILSFGAQYIEIERQNSTSDWGFLGHSAEFRQECTSEQLDVCADESAEPFSELVRDTILPVIRDSHQTWQHISSPPPKFVLPLITRGKEAYPHAFIVPRYVKDGKSAGPPLVVLPSKTRRPDKWLRTFQGLLHDYAPTKFPLIDDWSNNDPRWLPLETEMLLKKKRQSEAELKETIEQLEAEIQETKLRLDQSLVGHRDTGVQRLLTAQGDDLTDAVKEALETLGYAVQDMDAPKAPGEPRLEDLRITLPGRTGWTVLAEVKGYKNDAKVNDLQQLPGRPLRKYVDETGHRPSSLWHIVNTRIEENPSARKRARRHFNTEDTTLIAEYEGLILETRDLFEAAKAVDRGDHTPEEIRSAIETSELYWTAENGLTHPGYES